ncbi:hypothetical protein [Mycobacterium sp. AZCC_0083]|uniref:hypothetical protein n=1 Tax=Mycobacterium sp. AZCC_0083 TaxID=2735882 RepID=UPI001616A5DF|nr:hypothetical protein [Mycobacterium sp. AZCC_0083]MBB5167208.1 hypothetical protein [Mycobacterium sp. AZCC_0083]
MTQRGATGVVYRAAKRNAHGDPVDDDGNVIRVGAEGTEVGTIHGIITGGLSASPSLQRQESSDTSGQIGIPNKQPIRVRFGDRILIDGTVFRVISKPLWIYANQRTGTKPEFTWVEVEGTAGAPGS